MNIQSDLSRLPQLFRLCYYTYLFLVENRSPVNSGHQRHIVNLFVDVSVEGAVLQPALMEVDDAGVARETKRLTWIINEKILFNPAFYNRSYFIIEFIVDPVSDMTSPALFVQINRQRICNKTHYGIEQLLGYITLSYLFILCWPLWSAIEAYYVGNHNQLKLFSIFKRSGI